MEKFIRIFAPLLVLLTSGCASQRVPVPVGTVPRQQQVLAEDEAYGHEVLNKLTERFQLDRDDSRINRVREIVDALTAAAGAQNNPWHVYVLVDDSFANAAATRGNYIFVWTGILKEIRDDGELATVLSHEIAHVLAGHTRPDPAEEVNRMLAGMAGRVAREVLENQPGSAAAFGALAEVLITQTMAGLIVNPNQRKLELEADRIGLFLMADAGFDPDKAVEFWARVEHNPRFGSSDLQFLSTHPSSKKRLAELRRLLPLARERYLAARSGRDFVISRPVRGVKRYIINRPSRNKPVLRSSANWVVVEPRVTVHTEPRQSAKKIATLYKGQGVQVTGRRGRWLRIVSPVKGYVQGYLLSPKE
ncbi:MAG: hypothetical protein D6719_13240 [Candidatus Dadabacteria bacterium]|nr:MAG: hypothetical protein D6719_13240 [Candidatus Dadabacteria bacterium]